MRADVNQRQSCALHHRSYNALSTHTRKDHHRTRESTNKCPRTNTCKSSGVPSQLWVVTPCGLLEESG